MSGEPALAQDKRLTEKELVRFSKFVTYGHPEECWLWRGSHDRKGYGFFDVKGRSRRAHRVFYEHVHGPIPNGLHIDHLCRVPACVNPNHLEVVTRKENTLRGVSFSAQNARKSHCPAGHSYDERNARRTSCGRRRCRACDRIRSRVWWRTHRGKETRTQV